MTDLRTRAAAAAADLHKSARLVGKPGAVAGAHVAGPTRGRSVVVLDLNLAALLDELVAALDAQQTVQLPAQAAPTPAPAERQGPTPPASPGPKLARFRGLEYADD